MYLTIEMMGDEIFEIIKKKEGEKDLYEINDILDAIVNEIDNLKYEIEKKEEEIKELKNDDNYDYSLDYANDFY